MLPSGLEPKMSFNTRAVPLIMIIYVPFSRLKIRLPRFYCCVYQFRHRSVSIYSFGIILSTIKLNIIANTIPIPRIRVRTRFTSHVHHSNKKATTTHAQIKPLLVIFIKLTVRFELTMLKFRVTKAVQSSTMRSQH
jgi:hypothetical protein